MNIKYHELDEKYSDYLTDEAGLIVGQADRIYFPEHENEIKQLLRLAYRENIPVTISGGGTGLSGGRSPLGGWIIATDKMDKIFSYLGKEWKDKETGISYHVHLNELNEKKAVLTVPVSMTIKAIQNYCREHNWFYPPDSTERSAFIGGNVSSNASGSRSFKYGVTRDWVSKIRVVTPMGELFMLQRTGDKLGNSRYIDFSSLRDTHRIPIPNYTLPSTKKNVAGPVITNKSVKMDLFIGTGGMFGVLTEVSLRLIRPPSIIVNIFVYCPSFDTAMKLIERCRNQRDKNLSPIPLSVEYLDDRSVNIIRQKDSSVPEAEALVIIEQDFENEDQMDKYLTFWMDLFEKLKIENSSVAQRHKEIEHHRFLRHSVPETVNAQVKAHGQSKLGTDYAVPHKNFVELMKLSMKLGKKFESNHKFKKEIGYAIWAHAGDSHVHLNFLPRSDKESKTAKEHMVKLMKKVVSRKGTIAAEHGLGKKSFAGKPALYYQYGDKGLAEVREMKLSMDPKNLLNRGNLIPLDD